MDDEPEEMVSIASICNNVVDDLVYDLGEVAVYDLLFAIERRQGWYTEIIATVEDVDQLMFDRHCSFDKDIWAKAQKTKAWTDMTKKMFELSNRYLTRAIDEVVQRELLDTDQ